MNLTKTIIIQALLFLRKMTQRDKRRQLRVLCVFAISTSTIIGERLALYSNKLEFPKPKDAFFQVWLVLQKSIQKAIRLVIIISSQRSTWPTNLLNKSHSYKMLTSQTTYNLSSSDKLKVNKNIYICIQDLPVCYIQEILGSQWYEVN